MVILINILRTLLKYLKEKKILKIMIHSIYWKFNKNSKVVFRFLLRSSQEFKGCFCSTTIIIPFHINGTWIMGWFHSFSQHSLSYTYFKDIRGLEIFIYFLSSSFVARFTHIICEEVGESGVRTPIPTQIIPDNYQLSYTYEEL